MKTQRLKIFEPHVFPINSKFFILSDNSLFENKLQLGIALDENGINESSRDNPYIKLINVGQGIAKDIFVNILYGINYHSFFEFLKTELEKIDTQIKVNISDSSCWIEKRKGEKIEFISNFPFESFTEQKTDYILPLKDSNEFFKIVLPTSIISAISFTIFLFQNRFNERPIDLFEKIIAELNISIKVKYKDNLNKVYSENFKIVLDLPNLKYDSITGGMIYCLNLNRENKYFTS
ncbi:MAG: hypothetical protein A2033_18640 [Bacteroidetes bacterium GWA2_31_9]|nr:MAG: hypothetical protein A2033_18640 [Bacteroidetes bacterium GWA2_31_9]